MSKGDVLSDKDSPQSSWPPPCQRRPCSSRSKPGYTGADILALNSFSFPKRASCTAAQHCPLAPAPEQCANLSREESFPKATDTSLTQHMTILMARSPVSTQRSRPSTVRAGGYSKRHTVRSTMTTGSGNERAPLRPWLLHQLHQPKARSITPALTFPIEAVSLPGPALARAAVSRGWFYSLFPDALSKSHS